MFASLVKAAVSVALTPAAVVADVLTLPSSGYNDRHPFGNTSALLNNAGRCVKHAVRPPAQYDLERGRKRADQ